MPNEILPNLHILSHSRPASIVLLCCAYPKQDSLKGGGKLAGGWGILIPVSHSMLSMLVSDGENSN